MSPCYDAIFPLAPGLLNGRSVAKREPARSGEKRMRPTFKKLEVKDLGDLEKLVAENVEGIETGLKVIDTRLVLGQAAIDLVGLDSQGLLVLIALDFTADRKSTRLNS